MRNHFGKVTLICLLFVTLGKPSDADTIDFSGYSLISSFRSDGLIRLDSIGTWNGNPVSDTNQPDAHQRRLAATMNFFGQSNDPRTLWLQVSDVVATNFGWAWGGAFVNLTQTGVRFYLPTRRSTTILPPTLDTGWANPGQQRAYSPPDGSVEAVTETPGFGLVTESPQTYRIQTLNSAEYGFINSHWRVYGGASRLLGGGVFRMQFDKGTDVFRDFDYGSALVEAQYGAGNQYVPGVFTGGSLGSGGGAVPEPSEWAAMGILGAGLAGLVLRKRRSCNR